MAGQGDAGGRIGACGLVVIGLLLAVAALAPAPAVAQVFDLSRILGSDESAPEPMPPGTPLAPPAGARSTPTASDYARLAEAVAETRSETAAMAGTADTYIRVFRSRLLSILTRAPDALGEVGTTLAAASPTGRPIYFLGVAIFAALLLVTGRAVAELYYIYVARPVFVRMQKPHPVGYAEKVPVLASRVLLGLPGLAMMLLVAVLVGLFFYQDHRATMLTVLLVFATYFCLTIVHTLWRMILAPYLPEYRLPAVSDTEARQLYLWLTAASAFAVAASAFAIWMEGLGLPREVHVLVTLVFALGTVALLLGVIRANADIVSAIILAGRPRAATSWITRLAASLWAPVTAVYLVFSWGDLAFRLVMGIDAGPGRLLVPYLILIGGFVLYGLVMYVIERVFARQRRMRQINRLAEERRRADEAARHAAAVEATAREMYGEGAEGEEEGGATRAGTPASSPPAPVAAPEAEPAPSPMPSSGIRTMEDLARRVASLLAVGIGAWLLIRFWGGPELFEEEAIFGIAEDLIDILLIGYVVFHATRIWLDQKIAEEGGDDLGALPLDGEGGGVGATRLATLLPLVRNSILTVIAVTVGLILAMELGVNVAPLFAGAGIVGLAIGFGAQTLVRDIISGAFFLIDDAFRKGEYIDVGEVKGTVEKISIRSFQLRHHLGMLHTIPFGEITHLTNFSRDWVMMKLPLRLTYDTDVERVRKLVKKLGQELLEDPEVGPRFLQPLKSQGVIQMEDSAMIVRVKFMTRPGDQWVVRKRVYQEIRGLFAREGIRFAHREVTVRIPDMPNDGRLDEGATRAIGAAARTVLDAVEGGAMAATGTRGRVDDR